MANGDLIDIDESVPEGAGSFTWYAYTGKSIARFSAAWSGGNTPTAVIEGAAINQPCRVIENAYQYTTHNLRQAAFAGIPLDAWLAKQDRRAHAKTLNDSALWGRGDIGLPGLIKHEGITVIDAPFNAGSTSRYFSRKSVDEVLADVALLIQTAGQVSYGMRQTTDIAFARAEYDLLSTRRLGAGDGGMTIMSFINQIYPGVRVSVLEELAATLSVPQGGTQQLATNAALAFVKSPDTLSLVVPMRYLQHPPQFVDLKIKINTESMTGGVVMKEPPTVVRMDQVGYS